jgi:hypothetical protein
LNDPTTPELVSKIPLPSFPESPKVNIIGFKSGPLVQEDAVRIQAASVLVTISTAISWIQKILPFNKWYAGDTLTVVPRAGKNLNAFYDRWGLHFHYDVHPITRKVIFTSDSAEAVSHELGHAILDVFRPDMWDLNNVEAQAYKETFGDIISILTSLQHPAVIIYALKETNGDMKKSNIVSRVAEEVGNALYHAQPDAGRSPNYLRDAVEFFVYQNPDTLPNWRPYTQLCQEPHNFSRIFLGAWYEILITIFEHYRTSKNDVEAMEQSRDYMASLTLLSLNKFNACPNVFLAMAKAMLNTEQEMGSQFLAVIRNVFVKRQIIPAVLL